MTRRPSLQSASTLDCKPPAGTLHGGRQELSPDLHQTALEKNYPRILMAIQSMWGYPELNTYFRKLTLDNRGDREGFPKEVWDEIFTLMYLHQMIVPEPSY